MELIAPLPRVGRGIGGNERTPKSALEVGNAGRVRAGICRIDAWVPLHIDIEGVA